MRTEEQTKGLVDAADRILKQLIRTPEFKESVIILLRAVDPPAARRLVRTLFWEDPALLMSVLGTLPSLINTALEALAEAAAQLGSMPPPLLGDLLGRIVSGIDGAAAGEAAGRMASTLLSLEKGEGEGSLGEALERLRCGFSGAFRESFGDGDLEARLGSWMERTAQAAVTPGTATHALVESFSRASRKHPAFLREVVGPLVGPLLEEGPARGGGTSGAAPAKKGAPPGGKARKGGGKTAGKEG